LNCPTPWPTWFYFFYLFFWEEKIVSTIGRSSSFFACYLWILRRKNQHSV
jgi:hypothetical protein